MNTKQKVTLGTGESIIVQTPYGSIEIGVHGAYANVAATAVGRREIVELVSYNGIRLLAMLKAQQVRKADSDIE